MNFDNMPELHWTRLPIRPPAHGPVVGGPACALQAAWLALTRNDEPALPEAPPGMPFVAVESVSLTMQSWLNDARCKPG